MKTSLTIFSICCLTSGAFAGQLIGIDSSRNLFDIDMTTGARTALGTVSSNAGTTGALTRDSATGTIYLSSTSNDSLFTLDLGTLTATLVGGYGTSTIVMHGLEWDSSTSRLFGGSNGDLFAVDPITGVASVVGTSGLTSFTNLGYLPATDVMYLTNSTTDSLYTVDRTTGLVTLIGPLGPASTAPQELAYDTDNGVMYLIDNSTDNLCTVDLTTGVATLVGNMGSSNMLGMVYIPDANVFTPYCFGDGSATACPCGNAGIAGNGCGSSVNPNGANLGASGNPSISADSLVLQGTGMPNSSALYFQGTGQQSGGAGVAFGDGIRCAGGSIIRLGTKANSAGASQYPEVGDVSVSIRGLNVAGNVRTYQVWYRNAAAFCTADTFNLTNGLELTWLP